MSFGAVIGTSVCIYGGAIQALSWMPQSWQVWSDWSEEGERSSVWVAEIIAMTIAAWGGLLFAVGASKMACRLVDLGTTAEIVRTDVVDPEFTELEGETGTPMQPPDFDEPLDSLDSFSEKMWAQVPEHIRKDVEQHVAACLPADLLAKLRELHARGTPISSDDAFFHFGGGMAVRNLCRERLSDDKLAAYCLFGDWDGCYVGVLAAIAAMRH